MNFPPMASFPALSIPFNFSVQSFILTLRQSVCYLDGLAASATHTVDHLCNADCVPIVFDHTSTVLSSGGVHNPGIVNTIPLMQYPVEGSRVLKPTSRCETRCTHPDSVIIVDVPNLSVMITNCPTLSGQS